MALGTSHSKKRTRVGLEDTKQRILGQAILKVYTNTRWEEARIVEWDGEKNLVNSDYLQNYTLFAKHGKIDLKWHFPYASKTNLTTFTVSEDGLPEGANIVFNVADLKTFRDRDIWWSTLGKLSACFFQSFLCP